MVTYAANRGLQLSSSSRIQPVLHYAYLLLAYNDFGVGEGSDMDAHFAKEMGGEFGDGCRADDELTVDTHEALRVELALSLFERHVQQMALRA